ncbi:hypothetical protein TWF281_008673 [Arthrobotrys megalospora]
MQMLEEFTHLYPDELERDLTPIREEGRLLTVKLLIARDTVKSVIADLLVTLNYALITSSYDITQAAPLVQPILEDSKRDVRPNRKLRRAWFRRLKVLLSPMREIEAWANGAEPVSYFQLLKEKRPYLYEKLDAMRHTNICLKYLGFEIPRLIQAAESLLEILSGEGNIDTIPVFPQFSMYGYHGTILVAGVPTSPPPPPPPPESTDSEEYDSQAADTYSARSISSPSETVSDQLGSQSPEGCSAIALLLTSPTYQSILVEIDGLLHSLLPDT